MTLDGVDAIRQVAAPDNDNSAGATPTNVFDGNTVTTNPTLQAILVGHSGSGVDLAEASGWTDTTNLVFHATPNHANETWTRDSGFASTTITGGGTYGDSGAAIAVEFDASAGAPAYTSAPSCSATTNGVICAYTSDATSTNYGVGVSPGDGTPTCTQIKAGQNDGGTAAIATGSDANTASVNDNITVTGTNPPARLDYHFCLNNGSGDSAVASQNDETRSARSGFAIAELTSISTTSIFDLDSYFTPDVAAGDFIEYEDDTNEDADCNVSFGADGDHVLTPVAEGDCDGKRTFNISYQDYSSATTGLFTAPTVGTFATDDLVCNGNTAPVDDSDPEQAIVLLVEDVAMTAIDLSTRFVDANGDALTFAVTSGTAPTGTTVSSAGSWTGTPTTENEGGAALTITATDDCGDTGTHNLTVYTVNTWTVPNLDNLSASAAEAAIIAAAPWREFNSGLSVEGYICGTGQSFLNVADQDPNAAASATPSQAIEVSLVGAVIPDVSGMTLAEAIAALEAVCP
jgi:hypothetical protein